MDHIPTTALGLCVHTVRMCTGLSWTCLGKPLIQTTWHLTHNFPIPFCMMVPCFPQFTLLAQSKRDYGSQHSFLWLGALCGEDLPRPEGINCNDFSAGWLHSWHSSLWCTLGEREGGTQPTGGGLITRFASHHNVRIIIITIPVHWFPT